MTQVRFAFAALVAFGPVRAISFEDDKVGGSLRIDRALQKKKDDADRDRDEDVFGPDMLRFNKFSFDQNVVGGVTVKFPDPPKDYSDSDLLPLTSESFPISKNPSTSEMLRESNAVSVITEDDFEIKYSIRSLIESVGGPPTHPTAEGRNPFWNELREVLMIQELRRAHKDDRAEEFLNGFLPLPNRWKNFTMTEVAEAVHDEPPGYHQSQFILDMLSRSFGEVTLDYDIIPWRTSVQFLRGVVMMYDINTWAIGFVGPHNFLAKWHAGRCRPEEIVWAIKSRTLEDIPEDIMSDIQALDISDATEFTAYPEGSPKHPSWPAMHSAASNISFWLRVLFKLTPQQFCEAKKVDYAVAYARTVAGVHYPGDNIDGLNMGQDIIARELPIFLSEKYGSSINNVEDKVKKMRFDWKKFEPENPCRDE